MASIRTIRGVNTTTDSVLTWYCLAVFALSWGLQIAAIWVTGDLASSAAEPWLLGTMFVPGVMALILIAVYKPARAYFLWRPHFRMLLLVPVAVLIPTLIAFGVTALMVLLNWGIPEWFAFSTAGVTVTGGPWLLGQGFQGWLLFASNVMVTGTAFALLNAIVAVGEELGWRGWLQGVLIARWGPIGGIAALGLLWSMWHLPGQLAGYNHPEYPLVGSFLLSPIELIATSFFLGWLTLRSKSFWLAAIAHGAGNSIQEGVTRNLQLSVPAYYEDLATIGLTVLIGLICLYLIHRQEARVDREKHSQTEPL